MSNQPKNILCQIGIGLRSEFGYWKEIYVMKLATLPKMQKYVLFSSPWFNGKENENQQIFTLLSSFNLQKYGKLLNKFMIIEKVQNKVSNLHLLFISNKFLLKKHISNVYLKILRDCFAPHNIPFYRLVQVTANFLH